MGKEIEHALTQAHIEAIGKLLRDMKYGNITIIVQDGKIIQIDKTEKYRLK
ncbi:MAG: YezD family protein [Lachnospiraceae bacterium]